MAGTCNPANGQCSQPAKPNGTDCNDGNACTQTDECQGGTCQGSNPVSCAAADQCRMAGVCNPANGQCSQMNKPNGTGCNDGNACTTGDECQAGACGGEPVTCTAQDQCHMAGTCQPNGQCSNPTKADGATCNDGNACTDGDQCSGGSCAGTPKTCEVETEMCVPSVGMCLPFI
jgi:hypothetical protein